MQGLVVDMTVTGVLLYVGFTLIDLDFAILWAVLAALFTVVPYYGAFASGLPGGPLRARGQSRQGRPHPGDLHRRAAVRATSTIRS